MTDETVVAESEAVTEDVSEATETPEAEDIEAESETEDATETDEESEGDEDEGDADEPESIELDLGGNKVMIPANASAAEAAEKVQEFADSLNRGYQDKFQNVAERAKALEAREGAVEKLIGLQDDALESYSRGKQLRQEISQLQQAVADDRLWQSDPDRARRYSDQLARKQAEFQTVVNDVSTKEAELEQASAEERKRRADEGRQVIERRVKDFEAQKPEFFDYVEQTTSLPREVIERDYAVNPEITLAFHKAMLFDRMQAKAKQTTAKPKPTAPANPVKPASRGRGGKGKLDLVRDADKMSADEWAKRRNREIAQKANQG